MASLAGEMYAHSVAGRPKDAWQTLDAHAAHVAERAAAFAHPFGSEDWARLLGEMHDVGKARRAVGESVFWARPGERLLAHLTNVASVAGDYAAVFGGRKFAEVCGWLHDFGKYSHEFQDYIRRVINGEHAVRGETVHALQGALYAFRHLGNVGIADIVVNVVASHHGALTDMLGAHGRVSEERLTCNGTQRGKMLSESYEEVKSVPEAGQVLCQIDERKLTEEIKTVLLKIKEKSLDRFFGYHLFVRMVYSCLVDADRCDAAGIDGRIREPPWDEIEDSVERRVAAFSADTPLNKIRARISHQCLAAGERGSGIYTLSVPTGGGKTLSSLRFAVRHAKVNHLKRIIYVIPFLSIIDQTAMELRRVFGERTDEWMLEHHSNVVLQEEDDEDGGARKTLTERWDCPIVVTTMVRFLETVFSNRASDLRKLHNMAESVLVFDEIQALPIRCAYLFNTAINFLHRLCGATAVLCTATQPALTDPQKVKKNIVLSDKPSLVALSAHEMDLFKRVRFENKTRQPMTACEVAEFAKGFVEQGANVLVVLNTKKTALEVYRNCSAPTGVDKMYLSTDLCAQHRKDNIARAAENMRSPVRRQTLCVSTQLIEAGVDLSFDVVIRANAGIDSIVQAGGRCNRNGEKVSRQPVYIVEVSDEDLSRLPGIVAAKNAARRTFDDLPGAELTDSNVLERYYLYLYDSQASDMGYPVKEGKPGETVYGILDRNESDVDLYRQLTGGAKCYRGCPAAFARAAECFHVIDGGQIATVVPYAPHRERILALISEFGKTFDPKTRVRILRHLQPYTVSIRANREFWLQTVAEKVYNAFYFVGEGFYDFETGLTGEGFSPII